MAHDEIAENRELSGKQLFFNEWVTRWNRKQVIKAAFNKLNRVYTRDLK